MTRPSTLGATYKYRTRFLAADATRPARSDQHDQLRAWQAPAKSARISSRACAFPKDERYFAEIFFETSVTRFRQPATSARRLPVGTQNATNDPATAQRGWQMMAVNEGGISPIPTQRRFAQPYAFAPENLLPEVWTKADNALSHSGCHFPLS